MKSRIGPISLIVIGSLLTLGPLCGVIGTVVGMMRAFGTLGGPKPPTPEHLASDISISLWSTAAGMILSPIGLVLIVVGIVWLLRVNRARQDAEATTPPDLGTAR